MVSIGLYGSEPGSRATGEDGRGSMRRAASQETTGVVITALGRRRWAACGAAVLMGSLLLAGCGTASSTSPPSQRPRAADGGTVTYAEVAGESPNYIFPVNPVAGQSVADIEQFMPLLYEPLFVDSFDEPTIDYAASIGYEPRWIDHDSAAVLTLRHYRWSNGSPVTTRDITFYINLARAAGPSWGDYSPGDFPYNIRRIAIEGPYQMTLYFTRSFNPTYYVDNQLSDITPIPQAVWDRESLTGRVANFDESPAGARKVWNFLNSYAERTSTYSDTNPIWGVTDGAWKLASFGGSTSPDIFVPNPAYSGVHPRIARFEELPFTSDAAEYDELRSGDRAITIGYVPDQDVPTVPTVRAAGYSVRQIHDWGVDYMVPNLRVPGVGAAFAQLYVRQALQHLVDQPLLISTFFDGDAVPTYGPAPIYPKNNPFADSFEEANPYPYSVPDAKSLLAGHGWRIVGGVQTCVSSACGKGVKIGTKLAFTLLVASGDLARTEEAELYASDAKRAGILVTLRSEEFNSIVGTIGPCANPQLSCSTWELANYGGATLSLYPSGGEQFLLGSQMNSGQYENPTLAGLIHAVRHQAGMRTYDAYENLVATDLPWIWLPTPSTLGAVAKTLRGPGIDAEFGDLEPQLWSLRSSSAR
jgi:peptide/nickel transport system substrate-binding protein